MQEKRARRAPLQWQGCVLAVGGMLLACIVLVIGPTGYAFYRYRSAQIFSGDVKASGQPSTLPTQGADTYTLNLQPQVSAPGGLTLGFTILDSFGRTLSASSDFYTTGCPAGGPPNQTCAAQSRDFQFTNRLGGPVKIRLAATQPDVEVAVQVRDESAGGIFASGSLVLFGLFLGCGTLLWLVSAALIFLFALRLERRHAAQKHPGIQAQEASAPGAQNDNPYTPS